MVGRVRRPRRSWHSRQSRSQHILEQREEANCIQVGEAGVIPRRVAAIGYSCEHQSKGEPKMSSINFTKTRTYANLHRYWEDKDYELDVINYELGCIQTIDRNQAVDNEGHALYNEYVFYKIGECRPAMFGSFTAVQVERFIRNL